VRGAFLPTTRTKTHLSCFVVTRRLWWMTVMTAALPVVAYFCKDCVVQAHGGGAESASHVQAFTRRPNRNVVLSRFASPQPFCKAATTLEQGECMHSNATTGTGVSAASPRSVDDLSNCALSKPPSENARKCLPTKRRTATRVFKELHLKSVGADLRKLFKTS
jgi:hypothetical protein